MVPFLSSLKYSIPFYLITLKNSSRVALSLHSLHTTSGMPPNFSYFVIGKVPSLVYLLGSNLGVTFDLLC